MDKLSLYRKYRPSNFENLIGQDHIKTTLINAIKSGQIAHAYVFSGPRGTGKTTSARLMAKAINCENLKNGFEPCDECDFCKEISKGSLIDVIEIDAASNTGVDNMRELKENISFAPTRSKAKVYVIDEFHMLSKSAFNALLKTLEEPPANVYFILATTELHKIPETIISRCQNFEFKRISPEEMTKRLLFIANSEGIEATESALMMISKHVNGGLRDAISLLEQLSLSSKITEESVADLLGISSIELINTYYQLVKSKDTKKALNFIDEIFVSGVDLRQFVHDFINLLREKVMLCFAENYLNAVPLYVSLIENFQKAVKDFNPEIPRLALEMATVRATFDFEKISAVQDLPSENKNTSKIEEKIEDRILEKVISIEKVDKKPEESETLLGKKFVNPETSSESIPTKEINTTETTTVNAPIASASGLADYDSLKQNWISVLNHISKPTISRSLKTGNPVKIDGDALVLKFFSSFHNDIVMKTESKVEIEKSILDVTGQKLQIKSIVEEKIMDEDFRMPDKIDVPVQQAASTQPTVPKIDKATNEALDIFGGKLV
ncbi:MAG: DNA polymerase III subunit gamma/tau [Candidatus Gracilibacteria bacterium]|jgi:DNA polymerase-3 subunit gamma/tau|nr:DNA polymerase III subunit gamma/tau [Candidatus Gracilibacteria bacterium]